MRIKHKVNARIWETTAEKDVLFAGDDTLAEVAIDSYARQTSGHINIAASGTESLPVGDVTNIKGLFLKVDGSPEITINGAASAITMAKEANASWAKLFIEAVITAVSIENVDADNALNGVYCIWGD